MAEANTRATGKAGKSSNSTQREKAARSLLREASRLDKFIDQLGANYPIGTPQDEAATGQAGESPKTDKQHFEDLAQINPLIDRAGDTTQVNNVLGFLSFIILDRVGGVSLSDNDCIGLASILDTCRLALVRMNEEARP